MEMVIVEIVPGDYVRLPKDIALKLGYSITELKPILPEKNKSVKPNKTKKVSKSENVQTENLETDSTELDNE
jgi:hypothetical protein